VSSYAIERLTGIPRSSIRRYAKTMVAQRILIKRNDGFLFSPEYIAKRQDRRAFRYAINAVIRAARELQKVM
jgi:DNA-binding IclR family transcriptional regulator